MYHVCVCVCVCARARVHGGWGAWSRLAVGRGADTRGQVPLASSLLAPPLQRGALSLPVSAFTRLQGTGSEPTAGNWLRTYRRELAQNLPVTLAPPEHSPPQLLSSLTNLQTNDETKADARIGAAV